MTDPAPEASDIDRAEQSAQVSEPTDNVADDEFSPSTEADPADLFEQHREAPLPDDDYDR
jgi:hypothetical protein